MPSSSKLGSAARSGLRSGPAGRPTAAISDFIETNRLDVADLALTKFEELNKVFGNEFNSYLVQIKDKKALCLK